MATVAEGRIKFERVLARECERAKEDLESALAGEGRQPRRRPTDMSSRKVKPDNCKCLSCRAWRRIGRAKKRMAQGMEAERRRVHLLDLYDETNGR